MNLDQGGHHPQAVSARAGVPSIEGRILPSPENPGPTEQFFDALCTLAYAIVMLPAYLAMSITLALAFYVRCAMVLFSVR